jgi:hypothetical protein
VWHRLVKEMFDVEDPRMRVLGYYLPGINANWSVYKAGIEGTIKSEMSKCYFMKGRKEVPRGTYLKSVPSLPSKCEVKFKKDFKYATTRGNVDNVNSKMQTTFVNFESAFDIKFLESIRNPWLGQGVGTFRFEFPQKLSVAEAGGESVDEEGKVMKDGRGKPIPIQWRQAHNTWLQIGREMGLIGMFFALCIPGMAVARFIRSGRKEMAIVWTAAIIMVCLNGCGFFIDRIPVLMFMVLYTFARQNKEVYSA